MGSSFDFFDDPAPQPKGLALVRTGERATSPDPPPARAPARRKVRLLDPAEAWLCFDCVPTEPDFPDVRDGLANLRVMSARALWRHLDDCNREGRDKGWTTDVPLMGPDDRTPTDGWRRICRGWVILDWEQVGQAMSAIEDMGWILTQYRNGLDKE